MRKSISAILFFLFLLFPMAISAQGVSNYEEWESHPDVPRISAERVQNLMQSSENLVLIYSGHKVDEVVCNSVFIPYQWVPPFGSGAKVQPQFPKDWWVIVY